MGLISRYKRTMDSAPPMEPGTGSVHLAAEQPHVDSAVRNRVQLCVFLLTCAVGIQFAAYVFQAGGTGAVTVARPPGVEGFLPIGALMGWKLWLTTGHWDAVHPAGMVILAFAAVVSLALRKSFCSWFCPVGTVSEWLWKAGRFMLGKNFRLPRFADIALRGIKYALLGFFIYVIGTMPIQAVAGFLDSPYYRLADVRMLHFFTGISLTAATVIAVLIVGSLFVQHFWCRYACPYGALMGLFSLFSPARIERSETSCIQCGRCGNVCPSLLPVNKRLTIRSPECTGCLDCVQTCPEPGALTMRSRMIGNIRWRPATLGCAILLVFSFMVFAAKATDHWDSAVGLREFRMRIRMMDNQQLPQPPARMPDMGRSLQRRP